MGTRLLVVDVRRNGLVVVIPTVHSGSEPYDVHHSMLTAAV